MLNCCLTPLSGFSTIPCLCLCSAFGLVYSLFAHLLTYKTHSYLSVFKWPTGRLISMKKTNNLTACVPDIIVLENTASFTKASLKYPTLCLYDQHIIKQFRTERKRDWLPVLGVWQLCINACVNLMGRKATIYCCIALSAEPLSRAVRVFASRAGRGKNQTWQRLSSLNILMNSQCSD